MAYINAEKTAEIRKKLKEAFPSKDGWKFSLRNDGHTSLNFSFVAGPHEFVTKRRFNFDEEVPSKVVTESPINHYYIDTHFMPESAAIITKAYEILNDGNYNNSDIQTDYFDVGWYINMHIGSWSKDYVKV